jgi:hypothetical protein
MKTSKPFATVEASALTGVTGGKGTVDAQIMRSLDNVGDKLKDIGKTDAKGGMGDMTTMLLLMTMMGPKGAPPPPPPPAPVPVVAPASSVNVVVRR